MARRPHRWIIAGTLALAAAPTAFAQLPEKVPPAVAIAGAAAGPIPAAAAATPAPPAAAAAIAGAPLTLEEPPALAPERRPRWLAADTTAAQVPGKAGAARSEGRLSASRLGGGFVPGPAAIRRAEAPSGTAPPDQTDQGGSSGEPSTPERREARWRAHHVDLDRLPSAYAAPPRRLPIGNALKMPPIGFPASTYSLYPDLQFGVTPRTVLALGVAGANQLGHSGTPIFYTVGLQHLLLPERRHLPAVAVGGYGFLAPQNRHGGAGYLVASWQLTPHAYPRGAFVHLGLLLQSFADGTSDTGVRPFLGANYVWSRRLRFSAEYRPGMSWEEKDPYSVRAVFLVTRAFGVSAGYSQNGYRAHPFIGIEID